jgi:hypothetical protein
MVEDRERVEKNDSRHRDKSHWPPSVEIVVSEAHEVEPHEQSEEEAK